MKATVYRQRIAVVGGFIPADAAPDADVANNDDTELSFENQIT
jgi:hypothetical protein